jgi:hypothetical protein
MNPRRSFIRKIVYLAAVAVLLVPLYWLSQPTTGVVEEIDGVRQVVSGSPGGQLAQLRTEAGLSEAELGDLDPVGQTMQLATFGLRGVAAVALWHKSNTYQKKKDWTNLSATLNQLSKLEPHFITVWKHQAWNLSFNISAEFDDYRERYHWVIEGIEFLKRGVTLNRREPHLVSDVGWFNGHKIGRADEAKQFRELYRKDDDYHANDEEYGGSRPVEFRDNWLVGKYWFGRAEALVDDGASLKKTAPLVFFSWRPMCQMNYSEFLEKDGTFGEKARLAWKRAAQEWHEFGSRELPAGKGDLIRLNDTEAHYETIQKLNAELDRMAPGVRQSLFDQRYGLLTDEQKEALATPLEKLTAEQYPLAREAAAAVTVTPQEVARRITGPDRQKAKEMADRITEAEKLIRLISSDRQIVNFEYWRMRADMEQAEATREARENIYKGEEDARKGLLPSAKEYYDAGLAKWRELLDSDEFSFLVNEANTLDDLDEIIGNYRKLLEKRDEPFPENFILQDVVDAHQRLRSSQEMGMEMEEE